MRWRKVIETAAGAAAAVHLWPHNTLPQTGPGQPQIGVLCPTTCVGPALDAFRSALGQQGLREGQTVTLIYREAEGQLHRLPSLAGELAGRKVDVLFSSWGTAAPLALKQASATIPIVAGAVGDPVAAVSSRAWRGRAGTSPDFQPWLWRLRANGWSCCGRSNRRSPASPSCGIPTRPYARHGRSRTAR